MAKKSGKSSGHRRDLQREKVIGSIYTMRKITRKVKAIKLAWKHKHLHLQWVIPTVFVKQRCSKTKHAPMWLKHAYIINKKRTNDEFLSHSCTSL